MAILTASSTNLFAQLKLGDRANAIMTTSLLELESDSLGFMLPRLTETEARGMVAKCDSAGAFGLLIFNSSKNCVQIFDSTGSGDWHCLSTSGSSWTTGGATQ